MARKGRRKKKHISTKLIVLLILLAVLFIVLCLITPTEQEMMGKSVGQIPGLELPRPVDGEQIVNHTGYTLSYNERYEQPSYVAYELTREEVYGGGKRDDSFRADPDIRTGSATPDDYRNSGYDKGHLAPAADFKWSEEAMADTFFMSNMSPQAGQFNRGIWADLESVVRQMAVENESIYVTTGPVLTDGPYRTIGENRVAVPNYYYKVILDYTNPEIKAIGFVLPNEKGTHSIDYYAVTVDEVEEITGLDFFPALPDDVEALLEGSIDKGQWSFRKYGGTADENRTFIDSPYRKDSKLALLKVIFDTVFYEVKKEVFRTLGVSKQARRFGLI